MLLISISGIGIVSSQEIPGYRFDPANLTYTFDYEKTHEHYVIYSENKKLKDELRLYYDYESTADSIFQLNRVIMDALEYTIDQYKKIQQAQHIQTISYSQMNDTNSTLVQSSSKVINNLNRDLNKSNLWKNIYKYGGITALLATLALTILN